MIYKLKEKFFPEPIFRIPRIWSNKELEKFSHSFTGSVVNVSAAEDNDKRGRKYKDYFSKASSYEITNFVGEGIYLNLEKNSLNRKWDVVFNHTTLEHVYNFTVAFQTICDLSKETVILVVPFIQRYHTSPEYEDYWRFSKVAITNLFKDNGMKVVYISQGGSSISQYIFAVGEKSGRIK